MPDRDDTELSRALRAAREDSTFTQLDVVAQTDLSQARLSRIENGKALPTEQEVRGLARLYGAGAELASELLRLVRDAHAGMRDARLVVQRGNTLAMQQRWRALERDAGTVRSYQPVIVLGALQTASYAAIAMQLPLDSPEVRDRMRRRERFTETDRRQVLIQTEASLRQTVGAPEVMVEQLEAITLASDAPGVEFGVVPATAPMPMLVGNGFHIYDDTTVVVGLQVAAATLSDPGDVEHFRGLFDRLAGLAVWGDEARAVLAEIARGHRSRASTAPRPVAEGRVQGVEDRGDVDGRRHG